MVHCQMPMLDQLNKIVSNLDSVWCLMRLPLASGPWVRCQQSQLLTGGGYNDNNDVCIHYAEPGCLCLGPVAASGPGIMQITQS